MICKECGREYENSNRRKWCSDSCYNRYYYNKNKEKLSKKHKERYLKTYVPHPKPIVSEEDKIARRRKYYYDNREYYLQKSKEHYQKHKYEEGYKKRKKEALKRYLKRKKDNK